MSDIIRAGALALVFAAAPLTASLADRAPTAYENAEIGNVLFAEGFSSWSRIVWDDDGYWKVRDAIDSDGRRHDLELDQDLTIVRNDAKFTLNLFD